MRIIITIGIVATKKRFDTIISNNDVGFPPSCEILWLGTNVRARSLRIDILLIDSVSNLTEIAEIAKMCLLGSNIGVEITI